MLMYSVIIQVCLATSFVVAKMLNFQWREPLATVTYTVDLVEFERAPKKKATLAKSAQKKEEPKPKPPPKPEAKLETKPEPKPEPKPAPKPEVKKAVAPAPEKKVEPPKVVKAPEPKKEAPRAVAPQEPPKEEAPPPPQPQPEPLKVAEAVEAEPVAESSVDVDTEHITPELKWYIEIVRRQVWQNWIAPQHALSSGARARVVIRFEIGRDGSFATEPVIFESSNVFLLDQSGFRAVLRSTPFPPLPESYTGASLGVRFGFTYGEGA
jgi:outer membrane biosynthesis protein TonB